MKANRGDFSSKTARFINMGTVGYTDSSCARPVLATYGAGPCIIVTVYSASAKTGILAHIYSGNNSKSWNRVDLLNAGAEEKLQVFLAGGDECSKALYEDLKEQIVAAPNMKLCIDAFNTETTQLALDTRTGEVFKYFDVRDIAIPRDAEQEALFLIGQSQIHGASVNLAQTFDGRYDDNESIYKHSAAVEDNNPAVCEVGGGAVYTQASTYELEFLGLTPEMARELGMQIN